MADPNSWNYLPLGHPQALNEALEKQQKLTKLQAKYGQPLPPGMQGLFDAVNSPCACGCGTATMSCSTLCPPWKHLAGDHPSEKDEIKVQGWWQNVLPHAAQMAHGIADSYGVPVDLVLSPNLGTDADYVFQPHPDYGGYEVIGPPPMSEFAKGTGPTIGIVGHPALTKDKKPMAKPSYHSPFGAAAHVNHPASALWNHDHTAPIAQAHVDKDGKVWIAPKDPELPDWVQKVAIASQAAEDKALAAFSPPDTVKVAWDGEHWQVLENPTNLPVTGELLDNLMSMTEPGIYWLQAEGIASVVEEKAKQTFFGVDPVGGGHAVGAQWDGEKWQVQNSWGTQWGKQAGKTSLSEQIQSLYLAAQADAPWTGEEYEDTSILDVLKAKACICVTSGPDMDGPDIACPVHGQVAWELEQLNASVTVETGMPSPEMLKVLFGLDPEPAVPLPQMTVKKGGITFPPPEPDPEPDLFAEVGPEPDWCVQHQCHVTAAHPGDLVACITDGWIVPAAQKDGATP